MAASTLTNLRNIENHLLSGRSMEKAPDVCNFASFGVEYGAINAELPDAYRGEVYQTTTPDGVLLDAVRAAIAKLDAPPVAPATIDLASMSVAELLEHTQAVANALQAKGVTTGISVSWAISGQGAK